MPSKLLLRNFENGHYYHLRHQAKNGTILFSNETDYKTFVLLLSYYLRFPDATPLSWVKRLTPQTVIAKRNASELGSAPVTLHSFLLLPDHFHLVLRENQGSFKPGISNLLRRLSVGYAMYYNKTYGVTGTIYQGKYKMIEVEQNALSSLIHSLHHHEGTNDTYLSSPLHSSRPDYSNNPRQWISLIPLHIKRVAPEKCLQIRSNLGDPWVNPLPATNNNSQIAPLSSSQLLLEK